MIEWIHPGLLFVFGAAPIPFLRGPARQAWLIGIPLLAIADDVRVLLVKLAVLHNSVMYCSLYIYMVT